MTSWNDELLTNPHAVADKRRRVQQMFAAIAPSYDLNNRLHSLWMDQAWRRKAVRLSQLKPADRVVDVACGTGDLALRFAVALQRLRRASIASDRPVPDPIVGIDFTFPMLPIAKAKTGTHRYSSVDPPEHGATFSISTTRPIREALWVNGDAQNLPLPDASADVVSIAFGIRNVQSPAAAFAEFFRVLCPGGRVIVLEFSLPTNRIIRGLYNFYFRHVLPRTATLISGDKTGAYKYLPESVNTFIGREQMAKLLGDAGFVQVEQFPMTFGVCVCYRGVKL